MTVEDFGGAGLMESCSTSVADATTLKLLLSLATLQVRIHSSY